MSKNGAVASSFSRSDEPYMTRVNMFPSYCFAAINTRRRYQSDEFSIESEKKYKFFLTLEPVRTVDMEDFEDSMTLEMSTASTLDDESKGWKVCFSILNSDRQRINERPADLLDNFWICRNFLRYSVLESKSYELLRGEVLTIICEIDFASPRKTSPDPDWFDVNVPECQALNDLGRLLAKQKFTDVTFNIRGRKLRAHRAILAARSSVFSAIFQREMSEKRLNNFSVTDVAPEIFIELLRFIYMDKVCDIATRTDELLAASEMYDLKRLKAMCEKELCRRLKIENAANILILADRHGADQLKARAIRFIVSHIQNVRQTARYKIMVHSNPRLMDQILRALMNSN